MNRHEHLNDLETGIGVAVGVVVTEQTTHLMAEWITQPGILATLLIIILTISIILSKYIIGFSFNRFKSIRRSLIGSQFIEGTWFDTM